MGTCEPGQGRKSAAISSQPFVRRVSHPRPILSTANTPGRAATGLRMNHRWERPRPTMREARRPCPSRCQASRHRAIRRRRPPLSPPDVRRADRPGARGPGAQGGDRRQPRRPRLSVHRRPRSRQDVGRPNPGQGPQLRARSDAHPLQPLRHLPVDRRRQRRRRAGDRRGQQPRHRRDPRNCARTSTSVPAARRFKIYIIDEVHMLTREAFNALLKTLEEPPEHVKFIFCTTEATKIPITILSRCQRFDFAGIQMPLDRRAAAADRRSRGGHGRAAKRSS